MNCPNCGFENPSGFKFCGECGKHLIPKESKSGDISERAERRQLTVVFCDLVESTTLSEKLDPEVFRNVLLEYQKASSEAVKRFEGYIARIIGDGLLIYFGFPTAHEDDARRAIHSSLGIVAEIEKLHSRLQKEMDISLAVRIGVHTGLVVVGEMEAGDSRGTLDIVGETPIVAARLQTLAQPNTVLISSTTQHLIRGEFNCHALGSHTLKGISQPMDVYEVLNERAAHERTELDIAARSTPFVGRETELDQLLEHWGHARKGSGQAVLLSGEAGIGKTRLVQVVTERIAGDSHARLTCRCSPYFEFSAFHPVIDLLERWLQFQRKDSPEEKLKQLETVLGEFDLPQDEVVPLFAELLSIPTTDHYPPMMLEPQLKKQKTIKSLIDLLVEMSKREAVMLIVEDLHWIDPSTLELLDMLIDQVSSYRIFLMLVCRPAFESPWSERSVPVPISLERLTQPQVENLVSELAGGMSLPKEVLEQIVSKTDGVPLFVEELTRMVLESGLLVEGEDSYELVGPLPPLAIPSTLQDSLMARLDKLSTVKEVAQLGATLGREFSFELLKAVSPLDESTLQRELGQLVEAEMLYQRGLPSDASYIFKHALVQDAAYRSLLRSKRQQFHQHIAQVLETRFLEIVQAQPELIAHHFTAAGLAEQAIPYWQKAGELAFQHNGLIEAVGHLTKALAELIELPETDDRNSREVDIRFILTNAYVNAEGYNSPNVISQIERVMDLADYIEELPKLANMIDQAWAHYYARTEWEPALKYARQNLDMASKVEENTIFLSVGHNSHTANYGVLAKFEEGLEHAEKCLAATTPEIQQIELQLWGNSHLITSGSWRAYHLQHLGHTDQALTQINQTLEQAREQNPYALCFGLGFANILGIFRQDREYLRQQVKELMDVSQEYDIGMFIAVGMPYQGFLSVLDGQEEAIEIIIRGVETCASVEFNIFLPFQNALIAEAYSRFEDNNNALTSLNTALELCQQHQSHHYEAEIYRMKGDCLLSLKSKSEEVEEHYMKAIVIAQKQKARWWELRATVSLARLWQSQDKVSEARKKLSAIYAWFTEGFDTVDLKEAKTLLDELS